MENPRTWGKARRAIAEGIREYHRQIDMELIGASEISIIFEALHNAGILNEDEPSDEDFTEWFNRSMGRSG